MLAGLLAVTALVTTGIAAMIVIWIAIVVGGSAVALILLAVVVAVGTFGLAARSARRRAA